MRTIAIEHTYVPITTQLRLAVDAAQWNPDLTPERLAALHRSIPCPGSRCLAEPGQRCRARSGRWLTHSHAVRAILAADAVRALLTES